MFRANSHSAYLRYGHYPDHGAGVASKARQEAIRTLGDYHGGEFMSCARLIANNAQQAALKRTDPVFGLGYAAFRAGCQWRSGCIAIEYKMEKKKAGFHRNGRN